MKWRSNGSPANGVSTGKNIVGVAGSEAAAAASIG